MSTADDDDGDGRDAREARVQKALLEAHYVRVFLGPDAVESILATEVEELRKRIAQVEKLEFEVRRLNNVRDRIFKMIASWRAVAAEQREAARQWRTQVDGLSWHAVRLDTRAEILEVQALLLESTLTTR